MKAIIYFVLIWMAIVGLSRILWLAGFQQPSRTIENYQVTHNNKMEEKKYAVALVYQFQQEDELQSVLKLQIISANSDDEALGKAIVSMNAEMKNHWLFLKTVVQIHENQPT